MKFEIKQSENGKTTYAELISGDVFVFEETYPPFIKITDTYCWGINTTQLRTVLAGDSVIEIGRLSYDAKSDTLTLEQT